MQLTRRFVTALTFAFLATMSVAGAAAARTDGGSTEQSGGQIAGRVTNEVTGSGMPGVNVQIYNESGSFVTSATTDGSGNYTTSTIPDGIYHARTNAFGSQNVVNELYDNIPCPQSCSYNTGTPITVTSGAVTSGISFALAAGGRIGGTVTNAVGGAALAGVSLQVLTTGGSFAASTFTDAAGNYLTDAILPTGMYVLRTFNSVGLIDEAYNDIPCLHCDVRVATPVSVTAGAAATTGNINFALSPGGRVAGVVTNAATGAGIQSVFVDIYNASGSFVTSGQTNADGVYLTTTGLPTGTYFARTNSANFINELYNNTPCVPFCNVQTGTPISVAAGGAAPLTTSNINFALSIGGAISGTVTDAVTGAPLSGVSVQVFDSSGQSVASRTTDGSGNYTTATGLPTGQYFARTSNAFGYIDELYNDIPCVNCGPLSGGTPISVNAAAANATTTGINFALALGGRISGRVTNAAGVGLPNGSVQIFNANFAFVTSAFTNATGDYLTGPGLTSGTYYARTSGFPGYIDKVYNDIPCAPTCSVLTGTPISVTAPAPATTPNINFALAVGGRLAGKVWSSSTGAPIANVTVQLFTTTGLSARSASTDINGNYIVQGLPTGTYFARTGNSLGYLDELYNDIPCFNCSVLTGTPISVTASAAANLTTSNINFALAVGGRVSGRVTNAATGEPLGGVTVQVFTDSGISAAFASTDGFGNYITGAGLPTGTYYARTFNSTGFVDEAYDNVTCAPCNAVAIGTPITVTAGLAAEAVTTGIHFGLAPGGRITGSVTSAATGAPLANISVEIYNRMGTFVAFASTNAAGQYLTGTGLPSGRYFARTHGSHGYINEAWNNVPCVPCVVTGGTPIDVTAAASAAEAITPNINFALAVGGRISGRVTNAATGVGQQGVSVNIFNSTGMAVTVAVTNTFGIYTTSAGLPTGNYFARTTNGAGFIDKLYNNIECAGCDVLTGTPISVAAGIAAAATTSDIDFALSQGGRISGRVTNRATGAALAGIGVQIFNAAGMFVTSSPTNATGNYTIGTGLPTGNYFAKTFNSHGFVEQLFSNINCAPCDVTSGNPISVSAAAAEATTTGIDFALDAGGGVSGRVTDAATGAGLSNVHLEVYAVVSSVAKMVSRTFTDGSGFWRTATGLPTGNYVARTFNDGAYGNILYNNKPCVGACNLTTGDLIAVSAAVVGEATTSNINFALPPPAGVVTPAPHIVAGLTGLAGNGGWFTIRRDLLNNLNLETWRQLPWAAYNANGGGVRAASGNVDSDAFDEIVLGLNAGGQGWIAILDDGQHGYAPLGWAQVPWSAYNAGNGEVYPAVGDIDGDGIGEIVAGLGPGAAGWFAIFQGADANFAFASWQRVNWPAYNAGSDGSTHPAVADVDNAGGLDLVLGLGAGSQGWIEIKNGAGSGFTTKTWLQGSWGAYNAGNGRTYPAAQGEMIAIGLGQGSQGWIEIRGGGSTTYAHARWVQVSWPSYNNAVGETHPSLGNLNAAAGPELVVGLAPFTSNGGWFEVINPITGASLGWRNLGWQAFTNAGGGLWPAVGRVK